MELLRSFWTWGAAWKIEEYLTSRFDVMKRSAHCSTVCADIVASHQLYRSPEMETLGVVEQSVFLAVDCIDEARAR